MTLRKGKTKQTLESSINSTLLAVEVYNKPRTPFRVENYISLMIMAWTRLFHAHFNNTIGDKYYYKNKKGTRYRIIDGEKKAWDLKKCISEYGILDKSIEANLIFFIKLRNKIEHRHIEKEDVGIDIFGECQALLYNYEKILVELFGEKWAINENLAHSLQFSTKQTKEQEIARKKALSKEVKSITEFIKKYRSRLDEEVFNSQEFSVKLIQIPKILNNPKDNVPSIEFVNWSRLNEEDKKDYKKVTALIKDRVREVISPGKLKPGDVIEKVNKEVPIEFNQYDHTCLWYLFSIRPSKSKEEKSEFETNTNYCNYDEVHDDYVYRESWVDFIINLIDNGEITKETWKRKYKQNEKLKISNYR